ncbi:MAG: PTS system mannose/fructose/sorbose family transporter subunit IID [Anaerolineae bacterium]
MVIICVAIAASPGLVSSAAASTGIPAISVGSALLIALCYYLSQSVWLAGLGFFTLYRPLIGGTLVGLIMGDPLAGARIGAGINLAYLGFIAAGGALPSDISLAGYLGTALALGTGLDERAALALTLPLGMLGYLIFQLRMTLDIGFVRWGERLAQRGATRELLWCNVIAPQALLLILCAVPCFIAVYWGPAWLSANLAMIPVWILNGLAGAGALLPLVGLAYSLYWLWHGENGAWFILGFIIAALTDVPLLVLVLAAGCVAWLRFRRVEIVADKPQPPSTVGVHLLRRRDLALAWLNWLFFSHGSYNYERMQGIGFAHSMAPILLRLYPDQQERAQALDRHMAYYNCEPNLGALVNGTVIALEEVRAGHGELSGEAIHATKIGMMGAVSGVGDSLIQGTFIPLALMLGIGLTQQSGLIGPVVYSVLVAAVIWGIGAFSFILGYYGGQAAIVKRLSDGSLRGLLEGLEMVGSVMLGALLARVVNLSTNVNLIIGGQNVKLDEMLNDLFPHLITFVLCLGFVWLFRHRVKIGWVISGALVIGFVASLAGVI